MKREHEEQRTPDERLQELAQLKARFLELMIEGLSEESQAVVKEGAAKVRQALDGIDEAAQALILQLALTGAVL